MLYVMIIEKRCYKFRIKNGTIVDITPNIIESIIPFLQKNTTDREACGLLVGYKNKMSGNITINNLSLPGKTDTRNRVFCQIKDRIHRLFLKNQTLSKNYYIGNWHTHPQDIPFPSRTDFVEWNTVLKKDKTSCHYAFFLIFGNREFKMWYGDYRTMCILEAEEMPRNNDLYIKE